MDRGRLRVILVHVGHSIPDDLNAFTIGNPVVDTIAAENNEVVLVLNLESFDFWSCDENTLLATKLLQLSFYIAERPADREASREDACRSIGWTL